MLSKHPIRQRNFGASIRHPSAKATPSLRAKLTVAETKAQTKRNFPLAASKATATNRFMRKVAAKEIRHSRTMAKFHATRGTKPASTRGIRSGGGTKIAKFEKTSKGLKHVHSNSYANARNLAKSRYKLAVLHSNGKISDYMQKHHLKPKTKNKLGLGK